MYYNVSIIVAAK